MDLNILWFVLICVLFIGFFFLEGFDYGVGILLPWLGRDNHERRMVLNSIGPVWDGNEVWMITAGGALFAAFPHWYATLFSGFYLALVLLLLALIIRGVGLEFRSKVDAPGWHKLWDWAIFGSSATAALLWGVAMTNILRGVPIDGDMHYVGTFFDLLQPHALLGGVVTLGLFTLHGALFLTLKVGSGIEVRAARLAERLWLPLVIALGLLIVWSYIETDTLPALGVNPGVIPIASLATIASVRWFLHQQRPGWAFVMTGLTIAFITMTVFIAIFPNVMISSLGSDFNMTIYSASASTYTLSLMTLVALCLLPLVLLYQGWTYWVFRKRITKNTPLVY